jgi:hypothetical protein
MCPHAGNFFPVRGFCALNRKQIDYNGSSCSLHFPKQWWDASGSPQLSHRVAGAMRPSLLAESLLLFLSRHMRLSVREPGRWPPLSSAI